jgi:hypothetical protein
MYHRWAALAFVLALCAVPTKKATGQQQDTTTQPRGRKLGTLGQNFPNPFNPETQVPFSVDVCLGSAPRIVTAGIFNILGQLVATPLLKGDIGQGRPLTNMSLPCGSYVAYWDGKVQKSGREAASGIYTFILTIDGQRYPIKMFVSK